MKQNMQFGVVGLGAHGTIHAGALQRLGYEMIGVDADQAVRSTFESKFDSETVGSPDQLYRMNPDAIVISTPNKFHEPTAVNALERGFDIMIEKPLAHNLDSARRIASAAEESDAVCGVSFTNKFQNVCRVARSYVEEGYFGEISHVRARHVRRRGIPGRGTWYTSDDIAGGGALMDIGANLLNLLLYLTGWPEATDIAGRTRSEFGKHDDYAYLEMYGEDGQARMYDAEDSVAAFCEFESGMTASMEIAWAANAETGHSYTLQGSEAGAKLRLPNELSDIVDNDSVQSELTLFETRSHGVDHFVDSEVRVPLGDPFEREIERFVEAIEQGALETNTVEQAMQVQRMIDDIYEVDGS